MKRVFVALDLPEGIKAYLTQLYEAEARFVRWARMANLHLTLRFIGDVYEEEEEQLLEALSQVSVRRFALTIEGVGVFPPQGLPKVLWAGIGSGHPLLYQLRQQVDDAILKVGLECDMRQFSPHITIGRCQGASRGWVNHYLKRKQEAGGPTFAIDRFTLFESRLEPEGTRYWPVQEFPLP